MYNVDGRDLLFTWLEREPDATRRQIMLEWIADIADDPHNAGIAIPGRRLPVYLAVGRLGDVTIKYFVAEQFHTVQLLEFGRLP